ncbi:MAG: hypothetical protein KF842_13225 [Caulobacter sp.]|nr:hypothetical protein [Caulobacter sp.]
MKKSVLTVAAGALFAAALAMPMTASAAVDLKVKKDTAAGDTGRCLASTVLFAKLSEEVNKDDEDKTFAELSGVWIDFLKSKDEAYQKTAMTQMSATADGYSKAMDSKSTEDVLAQIVGDVTGCLEYLE